ncbi:MAG: hypothetical protein LBV47_03480 [Bacteroidales bacterium]|nr:hypothetical protein [Bacteroidales bacterium]
MKKIKLICLFVAVVTISINANAQEKGDMAVGVYLAVGSGLGYSKGGVGTKILYNASNRIRLVTGFDYWRNNGSYINRYNVNVYAHLLPSNRNRTVVFYPFIGIGREHYKRSYSVIINDIAKTQVHNQIAPLLGAGIDIKLLPKFTLNAELRNEQMMIFTRGASYLMFGTTLNLALGLTYKLGQ